MPKKRNFEHALRTLRYTLSLALSSALIVCVPLLVWGNELKSLNSYVGSLACKECHLEEYENFITYAKKSSSFKSIERQMKHLTPEEIRQCYQCHTTGYGQPGGFVNPEETPHLKNAGCEVCHGPGALHVNTQDPLKIKGKMSKKDCEICHISERVKAFKYKPLIHGGAH